MQHSAGSLYGAHRHMTGLEESRLLMCCYGRIICCDCVRRMRAKGLLELRSIQNDEDEKWSVAARGMVFWSIVELV